MSKPLQSLNILDFSTLLPGPFASLLLADMGANVLRIESPTRPDLVRAMPPFDGTGHSAAHSYLNRNKRALALDLKQSQAIEIVKQLVCEYDIVIEQFRPGVMARLGLSYDDLKVINPKLIYCSITGYGQTGPLKNRAGHDINYLALSGIADYSRRKNHKPVPQGLQIADVAGGSHHAVMGILAAVIQRQQTQIGQHIDISMTDCVFSMNAMFGAGYLAGGVEAQAEATMLNGGSFYDYYATQDGRYMSVGSLEPQFLIQLCQTLEITHLIGQAGSKKTEDQNAFKQAIAHAFLQKDFLTWCEIFASLDCCVEPVLSLAEASRSELAKQRDWCIDFTTGECVVTQINSPIFKNKEVKNCGGKIGEDNIPVLAGLGFSEAEIIALKKNKVCN